MASTAASSVHLTSTSSTPREPGLVQEGWLVKRSKTLHAWRRRWVSLWVGSAGSRTPCLSCSPQRQGYNSPSEAFALDQIRKIWEVEDSHYGRPYCFIVEYCCQASRSRLEMRCVGLQAPSEGARVAWIEALRRATETLAGSPRVPCTPPEAPITPSPARPCGSLPSAQCAGLTLGPAGHLAEGDHALRAVGECQNPVAGVLPKGAPPAVPELPLGRSSGEGACPKPSGPPPKACKGKGKGPAPPPFKGKAKGIQPGAPKAAPPKLLPFGKRINMRDSGALPMTARGGRQESIFQGLLANRADRTEEDISMLQSVFSAPSEAKAAGGSSRRLSRPGTPSMGSPRAVLPDSEAKNCAIVLRGLPLRGSALVLAIKSLEPGPLDQDHLERLARVMPDASLMAQLKAAAPPLRDVEQELLPFAHLGRLQERLKALMLAANLKPQEAALMAQMGSVQAACRQVCEANILKQVLATVLVMFNYVNFGQVGRSEARAFDITTLLHLNEFRAASGPFPKFSALHYLAMRLLADGTLSAHSLQEELGAVSGAAGVVLENIRGYIGELRRDIKNLVEEQQANAKVYGGKARRISKSSMASESDTSTLGQFAPRGVRPELSDASEHYSISTPPGSPEASPLTSPVSTPRDVWTDLEPQRSCGLASILMWLRRKTDVGPKPPPALGELAKRMPLSSPEPTCFILRTTEMSSSPVKVLAAISAPGLLSYTPVLSMSASQPETCETYCMSLVGALVSTVNVNGPLPNSFEIATSPDPSGKDTHHQRIVLQATDIQTAWRWQQAIQSASTERGVGWLQVNNRLGIMRWRWAVLQSVPMDLPTDAASQYHGYHSLNAGARWLLWYRRPEDVLRSGPSGGFELHLLTTEVFCVDQQNSIFSISCVDPYSGEGSSRTVQMRARDEREMETWIEQLRGGLRSIICDAFERAEPEPASRSNQPLCPGDMQKQRRVTVPRLNLSSTPSPTESPQNTSSKGSAKSCTTTASTEFVAPLRSIPSHSETLLTEISKRIITPRAALIATPRIVEAKHETDTSSSDSESCTTKSSHSSGATTSRPSSPESRPSPASAENAEHLAVLKVPEKVPLATADVSTYVRMTTLAEEAEDSAKRISTKLNVTLGEGRKLLSFMGQSAPEDEDTELPGKIRMICETVSKFTSMLKGAILDVEKYERRRVAEPVSERVEDFAFCRRQRNRALCKSSRTCNPADMDRRLARDAIQRALHKFVKPSVYVTPLWERDTEYQRLGSNDSSTHCRPSPKECSKVQSPQLPRSMSSFASTREVASNVKICLPVPADFLHELD
eukprot:TRINITY_DN28313_c0_g1_i1.p1 TRINITY_DN28313_c0_g1~~TRINITY_DN28313_c0_g1_i1.p1  ORF type:complete len:1322 (-),score=196.34 TRINITY_DN28313_c0_g1_i1:425-4333(-)